MRWLLRPVDGPGFESGSELIAGSAERPRVVDQRIAGSSGRASGGGSSPGSDVAGDDVGDDPGADSTSWVGERTHGARVIPDVVPRDVRTGGAAATGGLSRGSRDALVADARSLGGPHDQLRTALQSRAIDGPEEPPHSLTSPTPLKRGERPAHSTGIVVASAAGEALWVP